MTRVTVSRSMPWCMTQMQTQIARAPDSKNLSRTIQGSDTHTHTHTLTLMQPNVLIEHQVSSDVWSHFAMPTMSCSPLHGGQAPSNCILEGPDAASSRRVRWRFPLVIESSVKSGVSSRRVLGWMFTMTLFMAPLISTFTPCADAIALDTALCTRLASLSCKSTQGKLLYDSMIVWW